MNNELCILFLCIINYPPYTIDYTCIFYANQL